MELRAVRGMKDILPEQAVRWQWLEQRFRKVAYRYGFGEVRTPLLEPTELFVREIGQDTDVVEKEMYSFERHDDQLTVRPEGTAGCARAYVQNAVSGQEPVTRWYYIGPMFRAERPAKGRYRQFHQAGCEIYGDEGPLCDAELIAMCAELVEGFGIEGYRIHLSSLGSSGLREKYRAVLRDYFEPLRSQLSDDSQRRLELNPLRILDSKNERDRVLSEGAPSVIDLLEGADRAHFERLCGYLDALGVPYLVDPRMVRGLDYYTRTLFELKTTSGELGAQDTLIGGGRYDRMIESLGHKKPVPAIGFAMGLERILSLVAPDVARPAPDCYLAPLSDPAKDQALVLGQRLRQRGLYCEIDGRGGSVKAMLRRAHGMNSQLCLLLGEQELARGVVAVKDLARHQQDEIAIDQAADLIASRLASRAESDR